MSISKYASIILLIALSPVESIAQAAKTPFSSFGIGETFGNGLTHNQGMAGVGISNPEYWHLNNVNPALLVFNTITVFEAGFLGEQRTARDVDNSEKSGSGNLNYLAMGFPIMRNKWGMGIGLMPYSSVNYQINYQDDIANSTEKVNVVELGSGGINQLYWSNGVRLHPNVSVGVKGTYYFSAIINQFASSLAESEQVVQYATNIYDRQSFSGFGLSTGASFHKDSIGRKDFRFNAGLIFDFNADINTKFYERVERRNASGITDSTTIINNVPGTTTIPQSIGAGVSFGKELQWLVGADFTYVDYTDFRDFGGSSDGGKAGWQFALGGKITPDAGSVTNYLKRMTYQTGISFSEAPYLINGNALKDFGINFGLTLPVSRVSSLDLAIKVGKRGDLQTNTIEENYFKFYFGVTFNDQWFIKRRFD